jgi:hypothetical protein
MTKKLFFLWIIFFSVSLVYAWDDCTKGIENCSYPGSCGSYTDTNNNNICDHSEEKPVTNSITEVVDEPKENQGKEYYFLHISAVLLITYIISFIGSKRGLISIVKHKKIWNMILLTSFLGVGLSGILLVLRITYGIEINLPFNLLFWHVETGIIMSMISIFHIIWHYPYFKSYMKFR